jgi:predicted dienelactone hydrolase
MRARKMKALAVAALSFAIASCCTPMAKLVDAKKRVAPDRSIKYEPPRSRPIDVSRVIWRDDVRHRDVPVTIYAPSNESRPSPVVIFSHGIGEDRDSYSYLGTTWAGRGFIAVHVTHAGTDKAMLRSGYWNLYRATKKRENWENRVADVRFVIDQLTRGAASRLRIDATRIAVAGHSAGAITALVLDDPRVKTIVAVSSPKIAGMTYDIRVPALHMTGTCDSSLIYRTRPRDRRVPFEQGHAPLQLLVTIEGARHETFSNASDALHPLIADITTAWLEATLNDDASARAWLERGGLAADGRVAVERR